MSNSLAIAAVTGAMYDLLTRVGDPSPGTEPELLGVEVTRRSLDNARRQETTSQLNLFLYQITKNAAISNRESRDNNNNLYPPPLALSLHYMVTAWGKDGDELLGHRVLGRAMRILHEHSTFDPTWLTSVIAKYTELGGSDLDQQIERIRITMQPLSLDEQSRLWGMFQARYHISVAYQVGVALIDSTHSRKVAPVQTATVAVRTTG